jgi:hypothetical protein
MGSTEGPWQVPRQEFFGSYERQRGHSGFPLEILNGPFFRRGGLGGLLPALSAMRVKPLESWR